MITRVTSSFTALLALLSACFSVSPAMGAGMAPMPLRDLSNAANPIIVGEVRQRTVLYDRVAATVYITRVIKGDLKAGDLINVEAVVGSDAAKNTPQSGDDFGLFFLSSAAGSTWMIMPPISGYIQDFGSTFIPVSRNPRSVSLPGNGQVSVLDMVIAEVATVLEENNMRVPTDIIGEYRKNPSPALKAMFAKLRTDPNPRLRLISLRARVFDRDDTVLDDVQTQLSTLGPQAIGAVAQEIQFYFANDSPAAVAKLGRLATTASTDKLIRSAAAIALARMHTQTALPFLVALLDDADPQIRAMGVGGIARFANNVDPTDNQPAAGEWKYRTDDTIRNSAADRQSIEGNPGIVAFWKGWWAQHKSDLGY